MFATINFVLWLCDYARISLATTMPWSPRKLMISRQPLFNGLSSVHEFFGGSQAACGILRSLIFAGQERVEGLPGASCLRQVHRVLAPRHRLVRFHHGGTAQSVLPRADDGGATVERAAGGGAEAHSICGESR